MRRHLRVILQFVFQGKSVLTKWSHQIVTSHQCLWPRNNIHCNIPYFALSSNALSTLADLDAVLYVCCMPLCAGNSLKTYKYKHMGHTTGHTSEQNTHRSFINGHPNPHQHEQNNSSAHTHIYIALQFQMKPICDPFYAFSSSPTLASISKFCFLLLLVRC